MKIVILTSLILLTIASSFNIPKPKSDEVYRTQDVMDHCKSEFSFFPYLDEFVTYQGWYRKADNKKSQEENLKEQINELKLKLFNDKAVDVQKMIKNKEIYNIGYLNHQLKISRIFELEDLLEADSKNQQK